MCCLQSNRVATTVSTMLYRLGERIPQVAEGCFVAPGATVLGSVVLHEQASVWFGAVLRGDNDLITIGTRSNIQDLSVLHTDPGLSLTIAEDVTVGHKVMLHGCTIGAGSLIGINAVVLNRAVVEPGCLIGAGSLIPEGKVIPAGSLVMGIPGKVVRTLSAEEQQMLRLSAGHYAENARRYLAELQPMD